MSHAARAAAATTPLWPRLVLLGGALLAALGGTLLTLSAWLATPAARMVALKPKDVEEAFKNAGPGMSTEAKAANLCVNLSYLLQQAYRDPAGLGEQRRIAHDLAFRVRVTNLPRLQLATLVMLELDRQQTPLAEWPAKLRPYLDGLAEARLTHEMAALADHYESVFRDQKAGKLLSRSAALQRIGEPHGMFLQFFTPNLRRVIDAQREAGDGHGANQARRLLWRTLAEFILSDGPIGARLLAADQLAEELERASNTPAAAPVVNALRDWRTDYIEHARKTPIAPPALDPFLRTPLPHGPSADRALSRLAWVNSLGVAALLCAVVATVGAAWWLTHRERGPSARQALALGFAPTPAVIFITWLILRGMDLPADFRRFAGEWTMIPRHLLFAGAITLAILLWLRARPPGALDRPRRFGGAATGMLLWLSVAWGFAGFLATQEIRKFAKASDAAIRRSWIEPSRPGGEARWQNALDAAKAVAAALPE